MIQRPHGSSRILITQPDHAALAAHIVRHWRREPMPDGGRGESVLLAVEQHDYGWQRLDDAPLVDADTGRILDFLTAPDDVKRGVWPRGVEHLAGDSYAAALVAQHAIHIYRRYRGK